MVLPLVPTCVYTFSNRISTTNFGTYSSLTSPSPMTLLLFRTHSWVFCNCKTQGGFLLLGSFLVNFSYPLHVPPVKCWGLTSRLQWDFWASVRRIPLQDRGNHSFYSKSLNESKDPESKGVKFYHYCCRHLRRNISPRLQVY